MEWMIPFFSSGSTLADNEFVQWSAALVLFHSAFTYLSGGRRMAAITSSTPTFSVSRTGLVCKQPVGASSPFLLGLPAITKKGRVTCSMEKKGSVEEANSKLGMSASLVAAAASAAAMAGPAMALVDERMSTEGTGLPFGLSNNLLGWILLGVFGLIWSLYTVYTSSLDEDEESGLSL